MEAFTELDQVDLALEAAIEEIKSVFPFETNWNITVRNEYFDPTDFRVTKLCYNPEANWGLLVIEMTVDNDTRFDVM